MVTKTDMDLRKTFGNIYQGMNTLKEKDVTMMQLLKIHEPLEIAFCVKDTGLKE